ncbi:MAG TPA: GTPase, partial [Pirellulales bacterium]
MGYDQRFESHLSGETPAHWVSLVMAVNLTPQYLKAQEEYRRAQSPEEELKWLETMWKEIPKHKASEKLQMELKTKLSELKKELQGPKKPAAKGSSIKIPRQGAGMVLILGGPNAGKSQLLASLTRATPEIAEYPFTTRQPLPGMMNWEDVTVQLVDTPPITADYLETYMQGLIRGADACVLMVDLGADEGVEQCQEFLDRLNATKTRLGRESTLDEEDIGRSYTQTLLVPNKIDAPGAMERLELFRELVP